MAPGPVSAQVVKTKDLAREDTIVVVMGPTGAGKSTFIDYATNQGGKHVGHGLTSCTTEIRSVRVRHPKTGRDIVIVDTPGFDDTHRSDAEILRLIADWLKKTYKHDVRVSMIVYMHRITDNRMAGTPYKNLKMFGKLCGDGAIGNVILTTTMWRNLPSKFPKLGEQREKELRDRFWATMIAAGSVIKRFEDSYASAWDVLDAMDRPRVELLVQEEMVKLKRSLPETEAAAELYDNLQRLLVDQQRTIQQLQLAAEEEADTKLVEDLKRQEDQIKQQLNKTFEQLRGLEVPAARKFLSLFGFGAKKAPPTAHAVTF